MIIQKQEKTSSSRPRTLIYFDGHLYTPPLAFVPTNFDFVSMQMGFCHKIDLWVLGALKVNF